MDKKPGPKAPDKKFRRPPPELEGGLIKPPGLLKGRESTIWRQYAAQGRDWLKPHQADMLYSYVQLVARQRCGGLVSGLHLMEMRRLAKMLRFDPKSELDDAKALLKNERGLDPYSRKQNPYRYDAETFLACPSFGAKGLIGKPELLQNKIAEKDMHD